MFKKFLDAVGVAILVAFPFLLIGAWLTFWYLVFVSLWKFANG